MAVPSIEWSPPVLSPAHSLVHRPSGRLHSHSHPHSRSHSRSLVLGLDRGGSRRSRRRLRAAVPQGTLLVLVVKSAGNLAPVEQDGLQGHFHDICVVEAARLEHDPRWTHNVLEGYPFVVVLCDSGCGCGCSSCSCSSWNGRFRRWLCVGLEGQQAPFVPSEIVLQARHEKYTGNVDHDVQDLGNRNAPPGRALAGFGDTNSISIVNSIGISSRIMRRIGVGRMLVP
mmetsp:Transcript_23161/g.64209  ORF Transcript_23161/g.64209 Transcript_23161/m.64209 type:complete len:227 (-) Transcript_23161:920-1600(-)